MRKLIGVALSFMAIMLLQGCATTNGSDVGEVSASDTMPSTPNTDYIYRSPSYQISHGGFGGRR